MTSKELEPEPADGPAEFGHPTYGNSEQTGLGLGLGLSLLMPPWGLGQFDGTPGQ